MANCLVGLGSNLGDRRGRLEGAIAALARLPQTRLAGHSPWYETPPVGGPVGQGSFLNGAALLDTSLAPRELLAKMMRIERDAGRTRNQRWAARTLDLDLLLYDDLCLDAAELTIPHPRMTFRRFVLTGAAEAAGWMRHPVCGWTVEELLAHLERSADLVGVATTAARQGRQLVSDLRERIADCPPLFVAAPDDPQLQPAKLVLLLDDIRSAGDVGHYGGPPRAPSGKMPYGPMADLSRLDDGAAREEAAAAIAAAWTPCRVLTPD